MREFHLHWVQVNDYLGLPNQLLLPGNVNVDDLISWVGELEALRDAVTDAGVDRELARGLLDAAVEVQQVRMVAFNNRVRADLAGTPYERALPEAFTMGAGESVVRQSLRQVVKVWTRVNAISPVPPGITLPLVLQGGLTLAAFTTAVEALGPLYTALTDAEVELRLARERRNDLQDVVYPVLKAYRLKVPVTLPPGHALADSLPVLTPPDGRTPEAVAAEVEWNAATGLADLTWAESTDTDLKEYEIRAAPGDEYAGDDEVILGKVPAGGTRALSTLFSLGTPGMTAGFKVYVVLNTGRERGSQPVYVTRPQ